MDADRCEIVERTTRLGGLKTLVTLDSPLSCDEVWRRFETTLPRFAVPPDVPSVLGPRPRWYIGSIHDGFFSLHGPRIGRRGGLGLFVRGTIAPRGLGSSIRLSVYSPGSIMIAAICGTAGLFGLYVSLSAIVNSPFNYLSLVVLFVFIAPPAVVGIVFTLVARSALQRQLTFLLDYLQRLFGNEFQAGHRGNPSGIARRKESRASPAVAVARCTERSLFKAKMVWVGGIGGLIAFLFAISVFLIFILPVWNDHEQLQRMVETRCVILDSRINERQQAAEKTIRRNGRNEQVPTGQIISTFKPEFLIRYEVAGTTHEKWAYASALFAGFQQRSDAEQRLAQFGKGQEHPCWHDPENPQTVVLDRSAGIGLVTMIFVGLFLFAAVAALPLGMVVLAAVAYQKNRRIASQRGM